MMKKVLILCAHRPGRSPSQRYRFEQYLPFLEEQGFSFTFSSLLNEKDDRVFYARGKVPAKIFILLKTLWIRIKDWGRFSRYDIIFIQREASFLGTSFFEKRAARSGAYLIFDFDDSIWLADTSPGNKKWEFIKDPGKFYRNLQAASLVIAGNNYLAGQAKPYQPATVVIPTTIDTAFHVPRPELRNHPDFVTIGWSGSISTVKHFERLVPVLLKLRAHYGDKVKFTVLGDPHYAHPLLEVKALAWSATTEVDELNRFDIGIMPLPDDAWSKGKCGLKGLSYMACEVATVMSDVGVNRDIVRHGQNGLLAREEEEWLSCLCRLIEDKSLREALGREGRKTVISDYSVIANRNKYLQVFKTREN
jgi:glycosyltransferase involved in cell wall biosynthesis